MRDSSRDWGGIAGRRLAEIAHCSLPGAGVTRLPFTPDHAAANKQITDWMASAGLLAELDAAGTLIGRMEGNGNRQDKTFIIGSHQDSVRNGGRFDGIMGVSLACLAVEKAMTDGFQPDFAIEVHAYADEEGVRFPTALLGPRAIAGTFDPFVLEMADGDGVTLRKAIDEFGGQSDRITNLARPPHGTLGYLEMHIEQGPVLEAEDLATGIVTSICGIERNTVTLHGKTGHAGTVPMAGRRDALVAASRIIAEANKRASVGDNIRATVGTLSILPGAVNQIPETVSFSLEIRSPDDAARTEFSQDIRQYAQTAAAEIGCTAEMQNTYAQTAQPCDPGFIALLEVACRNVQGRALQLPSGATHDASAMAALCPMAMLFVRCRDGVSHVPEEHASAEDMGQAIAIAAEFLQSV